MVLIVFNDFNDLNGSFQSAKRKKMHTLFRWCPPLPDEEIQKLKKEISSEWSLTHGNTRLLRKIKFKGFKEAWSLL